MPTDTEVVLEANDKFYQALGTRDLDLMETVWVCDSRSKCVHPGWTMLNGWDAIKQSWENTFDPVDLLEIKLSEVSVEISGDVAWVMCVQQLTYISRAPVGVNLSLSTNIFRREDGVWLMVHHHASPLPVINYEMMGQKLQ
ncbi:MAG: nuclear transport factor 2 family protein [Candidatus Dadabacteria bacterium]|nr:nuclear transport factor 2 family protein [Candidatus Dadabacteria bacterium]